MHRIIEAFTRAHDQVTGIDQIVMTVTVIGVVVVGLVIFFVIGEIIDRK